MDYHKFSSVVDTERKNFMTSYTIIPKGTIISGFAGIGKTTAALRYDNVIDLESSQYFFQLPDNLTIEEYEKLKGNCNRKSNPNGMNDYIDAILQAQEKYDYVLIAMFPKLIEELNKRNIDVQIVLPHIDDKIHYRTRYQKRGNANNWIDNMVNNWESYVDPLNPNFITNSITLENPINDPIILSSPSSSPYDDDYHLREYLSDIIDGEIRFKPKYIYTQLKEKLQDTDAKIQLNENIITIRYQFEKLQSRLDTYSYHEIQINLTPLADDYNNKAKKNDIELTRTSNYQSFISIEDFIPKFTYFTIHSEKDIDNLIENIIELVNADITLTVLMNNMRFSPLHYKIGALKDFYH